MPILEDHRRERFAQGVAQGMSATEAYAAAGYKPHRQNASRLMANDDVKARVAEIQSRSVEGVNVTLEWLIEQAVGIANDAREAGSYAAAVAAIKEAGVLSGKRVERQTQEHEGGITVEVVRFGDDPRD